MGRKAKYSKEFKIDLVKRYQNGEISVGKLEKETGVYHTMILTWSRLFTKYGEAAFDTSSKNASYTKEFKEKVVLDYLAGNGSFIDLEVKYHVNKTVIRSWVNRYNNHIELKDYIPGKEEIYMSKSRKVTQGERIEIVKYCLDHDCDYTSTAQIYETTYANVFNWVKKYKGSGEEGLFDKRGRHKKEEELSEIERLRRELKKKEHELEMAQLEVRLLKKAEEIERRRSIAKADLKSSLRQSKK